MFFMVPRQSVQLRRRRLSRAFRPCRILLFGHILVILSVVLAFRDYEEASGEDGSDGLDGAFLVTLPALSLYLARYVLELLFCIPLTQTCHNRDAALNTAKLPSFLSFKHKFIINFM